jgi:hypothetical protein
MTSTVDGTFTDASGGTGTLTGTFTPTSFARNGDTLEATGALAGTLTDSAGTVLGSQTQTVTLPVSSVDGTSAAPGAAPKAAAAAVGCGILDLILGPLHLDLLGLVVDLNQVILTITAVPGVGNLLGNLLCALAGLLDGTGLGGLLDQLVALLNQILGALNTGGAAAPPAPARAVA